MKSMDRLAKIDLMIDWESLRPLVKELYRNDTDRGGRPNFVEIVMIKAMFLCLGYNMLTLITLKKQGRVA